jgi:3-mercaptopyruvate sulfurtransferase SseA
VVACTLSLVYAALGEAPAPVYDGSWADWFCQISGQLAESVPSG